MLQRVHATEGRLMALDKKSKKRLEVLRKKLEKLNAQLAGAKQQEDEPGEVAGIEKEIA